MEPIDVHYLLTLFGVPVGKGPELTIRALTEGEITVSNLRPAKDVVVKDKIHDRNLAELAAIFRRNFTKEAASLSDEKSVDALLSLNFVNDKNLLEFMNHLPQFREVESKLAELTLYSQMGLREHVPTNAVTNAMKGLNEVNEHLEYLRAQLTMPGAKGQAEEAAA